MFVFFILAVGKFFHNLDVLLVKCLEISHQVDFSDSVSLSARSIFVCSSMLSVLFAIYSLTASISTDVLSNLTVLTGLWVAEYWYAVVVAVGSISAKVTVVVVTEIGEFPVFSVVTAVVLGEVLEATWVKIDILISLYAVSSCILEILKQESRSISS